MVISAACGLMAESRRLRTKRRYGRGGTWLEGGDDAAKLAEGAGDVAIDGQAFKFGDLGAQPIQAGRRP